MSSINKLVLNKINSMSIEESRKKVIVKLFEAQLRIGPDSKLKKERISAYRDILSEGVVDENN